MRNTRIEVVPTGPALGAEIRGLDLAAPLDEAEVATIRTTLFDRGVVFFRDQALTPEQHIAFAERFAPINVNRFFAKAPGVRVPMRVAAQCEWGPGRGARR